MLEWMIQDCRSCILGYMTKDQLYSMHMEVADNLEISGPECTTCKSKRITGMDLNAEKNNVMSYSIDLKQCVCLEIRPKLYSEISVLYSSIGLMFLPVYYKKKAAQASNNINYPIQALNYLQLAQGMIPPYNSISDEDKHDVESYFDPLVLEVSLKKTKAETFLLIGDTYNAASHAFQALEMLNMDAVCFHGVFDPKEFKNILPRFHLLHAEYITKLIGVVAKAYLEAHFYKLAQDILRIEYVALKLYPIDFLQVLDHMISMYLCKYWMHEKDKLSELEGNIFKLCHEKLRKLDVLLDLTEITGIGSAYTTILEINLALGSFERSEKTAKEAIKILQLVNEARTLPKIRILLSHVYYHSKNYDKCIKVLLDLNNKPATATSRRFHALFVCILMLLFMESSKGITDHESLIDKCKTFAIQWKEKFSNILPKDFGFYAAVCVIRWCLYCKTKSQKNLIPEELNLKDYYEIASTLQKEVDIEKHNYWIVSATFMLMQIKLKILNEGFEDFTEDEVSFQEEVSNMKHLIKTNYPLYWKAYKSLADAAENLK